jgi:NAD-dependent dihydropyrimidine dehydrogenase PreA subunit
VERAVKYLSKGVTLEFSTEKCDGCGRCREVCPRGVFAREDGAARVIGRDLCIECGACSLNCAAGALTVMGSRF